MEWVSMNNISRINKLVNIPKQIKIKYLKMKLILEKNIEKKYLIFIFFNSIKCFYD